MSRSVYHLDFTPSAILTISKKAAMQRQYKNNLIEVLIPKRQAFQKSPQPEGA